MHDMSSLYPLNNLDKFDNKLNKGKNDVKVMKDK